jgi:hypothetical protein
MVGSYFLIQYAILCFLIEAFRPFIPVLMLRGACCFQSFFFPLVFIFIYPFFTGLLAQKVESSGLTLVSSSICKSPLCIFCNAGLMVANSFSFPL